MHSLLAFTAEPVVEPDVTALCPAEILQSLPEGRKIGLPNLVVLREAHNDADTLHSILGARRELPDGRTAKYANEDAPAHRAVPPKNCLSNDANYSVHFPSGESKQGTKWKNAVPLDVRDGVKPGLPPLGAHVRFRRVQTLVREGSPLVSSAILLSAISPDQ